MKKAQFFTQIKIKNGFRGAQIKTWDFYNYVNSHPKFKALIAFHKKSQWSEDVFWNKKEISSQGTLITKPDLYILKGGNDWVLFDSLYKRNKEIPVISPIVNYRILNSLHPSNNLLRKKAIRICPNPDLATKLYKNRNTNGPVICIPHGVDINPTIKKPFYDKPIDLIILANKNPKLGKDIYFQLKNKINVVLIDGFIRRKKLLNYFSKSRVVVHLPQVNESFYLPGIESVQLGCLTIIPNCLGNVFYSKNNEGIFLCNYNAIDILTTLNLVLNMKDSEKYERSIIGAQKTSCFSSRNEKKMWHNLLSNINNLYGNSMKKNEKNHIMNFYSYR